MDSHGAVLRRTPSGPSAPLRPRPAKARSAIPEPSVCAPCSQIMHSCQYRLMGMSPDEEQIVIRIPITLGDQLRKYIQDRTEETGGLRISQASALRVLIASGLRTAGYEITLQAPASAKRAPAKKAKKTAAKKASGKPLKAPPGAARGRKQPDLRTRRSKAS